MPTYQYRCQDCGHEFDAYQSFSEDALTDCPVCDGRLSKVFGNVGIAFKGSGFYKNDSRSGSKSSSSGSSNGSATSTTGDSGSSSSSSDSSSTSSTSSSSTAGTSSSSSSSTSSD